ncbi:MAG: DNA mismatch repair protein MutS [Armatimonadetes bacterium]|nr:DNA mismatch repair protein MutS [Armatimonadota bacterium]
MPNQIHELAAEAKTTDATTLTPLFVQYYELKKEHPGCLMLMRVGDFYEAYGQDAVLLARDADIALTSKEAGGGQRLEMAGVPYFAVDQYLRALVEKGHRVALGEQMEDARQAKGLVRREVVRVLTAGTILDPQMLDETSHNFLACLAACGDRAGVAAADISTGEFLCTEIACDPERVVEELRRFRPAEVILAGSAPERSRELIRELDASFAPLEENIERKEAEKLVLRQFGLASLKSCDLDDKPAATLAAAALLRYLRVTQRRDRISLDPPQCYSLAEHMVIDSTSRRNLELTETLLGRERKGSLLWAMDHTCTSMGARRLRQWMLRPLLEIGAIHARSEAVRLLVEDYSLCTGLRSLLAPILDIERLVARVVYGTAHARDLKGLEHSLKGLPHVADRVAGRGPRFRQLAEPLCELDDLVGLLERALADEPPATLREGGLIRAGYHAELDDLRAARSTAREWIASLQEREREATGIRSLKVGFNQVFGYYLEVTRSHLKSVPDHYLRKQTLANAERYFTPELKEYEAKVLGAEDRIRELEYELFVQIRDQVAARAAELRDAARALSELDVLSGFAEAAARYDWCRPVMVEDNVLDIEDGRHPVVERALDRGFVPNHCRLDHEQRLVLLTGPNMSGKSTYLRQNALIVVMAQMGSYVPARKALIGLTDRVFTRVGASDDLHLGQSTFMVEMSEAANILLHATPRSLVILDEIGRGTSTYDGLALARAIAEHLHGVVRAKTLFATHFHELTRLARLLPGCRNYRVAVQENRDSIVFLHKIVPGGADRSYGIYVAQLAGVPAPVLERARVLLSELERGSRRRSSEQAESEGLQQLSLFGGVIDGGRGIPDEVRRLDVSFLTPEKALSLLEEWKLRVG